MKKLFTLIFLSLFVLTINYAQSGILDSVGFGVNGKVIFNASYPSGGTDTGNDIIGLDDGSMIAVSSARVDSTLDIIVLKFLENGDLDESFATNGRFHLQNGLDSDIPYDAHVLDDGSILVCGNYVPSDVSNGGFLALKLTPNGELDTSFGEDGLAIIDVGFGSDYARDMAVSPDGKIVLTGYGKKGGFSNTRCVLVRLNADGTLDNSFGLNGVFTWNDKFGVTNEMYTVILDEDENILTTGYTKSGGAEIPVIYKVLENGVSLDSTFGVDGSFSPPYEGRVRDIIKMDNGNYLAGGIVEVGQGISMLAFSFDADGNQDMDFGTNGSFQNKSEAYADNTGGTVLLPDGSFVMCAHGTDGFLGDPSRFVVTKADANGILDTSWGDNGITVIQPEGFQSFPNGIDMQPKDGKILVVGTTGTDTEGNNFTLMRFGNTVDVDMDGYPLGTDCDDNNADINPGAEEIVYNGIDDDCDPATLDDDLDQDGFVNADDCDDNNAEINPDANEIVYNGLDDDCNPETLDDDLDQDGFVLADDCNDEDASINPDAIDIPDNGIDEDCDGMDLTAISENSFSIQFEVMPNPTSDFVTIKFDTELFNIEQVRILSQTGQTIEINNDRSEVIDMSDYPSGSYILMITTDQGIAVKKVHKN